MKTLHTPESTTLDCLRDAFSRFGLDEIAISFSGAEDVVLIHLGVQIVGDALPVFTLDTGRLHTETYEFIERVRQHYQIDIDVMFPDAPMLENFVREKGLFSFYDDGHLECCAIRKVDPLRRKLTRLNAWITGQRRDQGVARTELPLEQLDTAFSTPERELTKFNPLANWTSENVWDYIRRNDVPYNTLHDQGFRSIGCAPCTRAVTPDQPERAGRWWWEHEEDKECGLHIINISSKG